jgi:hypothetical protein
MGMNIYTLQGQHIGKRYAAGIWCWDHMARCTMEQRPYCTEHRMNLVENYAKYTLDCPSIQGCFVSVDQHQMVPNDMGFIDLPIGVKAKIYWHCPVNKKHVLSADRVKFHPAQRELGFDKLPPRVHTGIDGASGFIWSEGAQDLLKRVRVVITEYGEKMSVVKFRDMFNDIIPEETVKGEFS